MQDEKKKCQSELVVEVSTTNGDVVFVVTVFRIVVNDGAALLLNFPNAPNITTNITKIMTNTTMTIISFLFVRVTRRLYLAWIFLAVFPKASD